MSRRRFAPGGGLTTRAAGLGDPMFSCGRECLRCGLPGFRRLHQQVGCDPRLVAAHRRRRLAWHEHMGKAAMRRGFLMVDGKHRRNAADKLQMREQLGLAARCPGPGLP